MLSWIRQFREANAQTKYFILNWILYGLAIILTTLYCYGRLDYVRSYRTTPSESSAEAPK